MPALLLLNGPNLNLLGRREPEHYGPETLESIEQRLTHLAENAQCALSCLQSNAEHVLIERVHQAGGDGTACILINPGAFTHTSIALRDALSGVALPFIEVHLSNIYAREAFRHRSYFSDLALGVIMGFGAYGYELALQTAIRHIQGR